MDKKEALKIILSDLENLMIGRVVNGSMEKVITEKTLKEFVEKINNEKNN